MTSRTAQARAKQNGDVTVLEPELSPDTTVQVRADVLRFCRDVVANQQLPAGDPNFIPWANAVAQVLAHIDETLAGVEG